MFFWFITGINSQFSKLSFMQSTSHPDPFATTAKQLSTHESDGVNIFMKNKSSELVHDTHEVGSILLFQSISVELLPKTISQRNRRFRQESRRIAKLSQQGR